MKSDYEVATLVTMRLSHYCEKARWGLDRVGFPYEEESHAPLVHRIYTARNKGASVPMLVHRERSLVDSGAILRYIDDACGEGRLYPRDSALKHDVQELERYFDDKLGPHVRRWAYHHLLNERKVLARVWSDGVPRSEAWLIPFAMPIVRRLIRRSYKITPDGNARSLERINKVLEVVETRLRDGRTYLVGDRFSAADLTFAALAAPLLLPSECPAALPTLEMVPAKMKDQVASFRETVAGQFAMRLYRQERNIATKGNLHAPGRQEI